MKIHHAPHLSGMNRGCTKSEPQKESSGFKAVFKEAIQTKTGSMDSPSAAFTSTGLLPTAAGSIDTAPGTPDLRMMERLVDALDAYQKRLGNPQYSLRDIEPSLERLEYAHAQMLRFAENSPEDSPLRHIITEGLVTTATEINRFRSGTYC